MNACRFRVPNCLASLELRIKRPSYLSENDLDGPPGATRDDCANPGMTFYGKLSKKTTKTDRKHLCPKYVLAWQLSHAGQRSANNKHRSLECAQTWCELNLTTCGMPSKYRFKEYCFRVRVYIEMAVFEISHHPTAIHLPLQHIHSISNTSYSTMKFSNVLFFATAALAAPTIQALDKRQTTVLGTVQSIANTITNSTSGNVANISKFITTENKRR